MSEFFTEFSKPSFEEWKNKIITDLKGKPEDLLTTVDPIEGIRLDAYQHTETSIDRDASAITRGSLSGENEWNNGIRIEVNNDQEANKTALYWLMRGVDLVVFVEGNHLPDWSVVLNNIGLEHIQTQFELNSKESLDALQSVAASNRSTTQFNLDALQNSAWLNESAEQRAFIVDGYPVQQAGSSAWQEITFMLNVGHEYLLKLMGNGQSIDQATSQISFRVGIGSNFFLEISKIRAFRTLWANVVAAYSPANKKSLEACIGAQIGLSNKSLLDPHTNLLRQTTETLSALSGGVDYVVVLPHDSASNQGVSELAQRMAINIPLILKEESYLDKVIDPAGGSYTVEKLTERLSQLSWEAFKILETEGGLFESKNQQNFAEQVAETRKLRIEQFLNSDHTLIGINKFDNPDSVEAYWKALPSYLGMEPLIFEQFKKVEA